MEENGNLVITKLAASDQGRYVCLAQNIVGIRETSPVQLTVNGTWYKYYYGIPSVFGICLFVLARRKITSPLGVHSSRAAARKGARQNKRAVRSRFPPYFSSFKEKLLLL